MALVDFLSKLFGRRPVFLYEFTSGENIWRFTRGADDYITTPDLFQIKNLFLEENLFSLTWHGDSGIKHPKLRHSIKSNGGEVSITFPLDSEFARLFLDNYGMPRTKLTIYEGDANDEEQNFVPIYRGQIIETTTRWKEAEIDLVCNKAIAALDGIGHTLEIHPHCTNEPFLPGGRCGLVLTDWQVEMTATAATGRVLTVPLAGFQVSGFFTGGIFEHDGVKDMILEHVGNQILLATNRIDMPLKISEGGWQTVKLARMCPRDFDTCEDYYNNGDNYLGFHAMQENILGSGRPIR